MSDVPDNKGRRNQPPMTQSQSQSATGDAGFASRAKPEGLLSRYQRAAGAFDELLDGGGKIFSHYAKLMGELEAFGAAELSGGAGGIPPGKPGGMEEREDRMTTCAPAGRGPKPASSPSTRHRTLAVTTGIE